jgi:uncharacterized protein with PQ loop repeat
VGLALGLAMAVPQAATIWRRRSHVGVSGPMWLLLIALYSAWAGFGIRTSNGLVIAANVIAILPCLVVLLGLARVDDGTRHLVRDAAAVVLLVVCGGLLGFHLPLAAVTVLLCVGSLVRVPQVSESWTSRRRAVRSDVSLSMWWMSVASAFAWLIHGWLGGDSVIVASSVVSLLVSAPVVALELDARRARASAAGDLVVVTDPTNGA